MFNLLREPFPSRRYVNGGPLPEIVPSFEREQRFEPAGGSVRPGTRGQIKEGVQVVISHPKPVETGLDLLDFPTIIFYESGYSLHLVDHIGHEIRRVVLRQPVAQNYRLIPC
jgi:hypothetical protein